MHTHARTHTILASGKTGCRNVYQRTIIILHLEWHNITANNRIIDILGILLGSDGLPWVMKKKYLQVWSCPSTVITPDTFSREYYSDLCFRSGCRCLNLVYAHCAGDTPWLFNCATSARRAANGAWHRWFVTAVLHPFWKRPFGCLTSPPWMSTQQMSL